jgi:putative spermidine/putrescine transport system permease protein
MVALACCALNATIRLPLAYSLHHRAQAGGGSRRAS